jgi:hypothetical protein
MSDDGNIPEGGDPRELLQEKILEDHSRLGPGDTFRFGCHPGVSCFNTCCADVNIFLSPYDVLRLRKRLGISSTDFLEKYTLLPLQRNMTTPAVLLRMNEDEAKSCPFLTEQGCGVYSDRPWPCRMYPVGLATSRDTPDGWRGERFYFLLREEGCLGFQEAREWTIQEWLDDQEVDEFDEWGEAYKELSLHRFFEVDDDFIHEMQTSDEALLRFGFWWVRFALFGEQTMRIRPEAVQEVQEKLEKRVLSKKKTADSSLKEAQ